MVSDQCAVGPDGCLKDASEITWHNDPDDEQPLSVPKPAKSTPVLHSLFTSARRSARAPRPSTKILDPDNVALSSSTHGKRKATDDPATKRRIVRKTIAESSASASGDSDDAGHDSDGAADTEIEDNVEASYAITKAMGDADREAGTTRSKSDRTADVRTIFVKKDDYLDPHTSSLESGHICTVCE